MKEWINVKGFEGIYQINKDGDIKSLARTIDSWHGARNVSERILKPFNDPRGFQVIHLFKNGSRKTFIISKLIKQYEEAFKENIYEEN